MMKLNLSPRNCFQKFQGFNNHKKNCFQSHSDQIVVLFGLRMVLCTYLGYQQVFATPSISKQLPGQGVQ